MAGNGNGDRVRCASLGHGTRRCRRADAFGDFAFDAPAAKNCTLQFEAPGYRGRSEEIALKEDVTFVGEVVLRR